MKRPIFILEYWDELTIQEAEEMKAKIQPRLDKWVKEGMKEVLILGKGNHLNIYFVEDEPLIKDDIQSAVSSAIMDTIDHRYLGY